MGVPLHVKYKQQREHLQMFPLLLLIISAECRYDEPPHAQAGRLCESYFFHVFFRLMGRRCSTARRSLPLNGISG